MDRLRRAAASVYVCRPRAAAPRPPGRRWLTRCAALHGDEKYIVLTSDTGAQAQAYLGDLRELLESNEALLRDYPAAAGRGPLWRGDAIRLRNGVEVAAFGTGGKIRGRKARGLYRPGLIVVDDPQNKDHVISPLMRERSWDWLTRDVLNAGDPETNIVVLGTALHRESIVCRLQKTPGWRTKVFKSIGQMPAQDGPLERMGVNTSRPRRPVKGGEGETVYLQAQGGDGRMTAAESVLWPERESLYELMLLRRSAPRRSPRRTKRPGQSGFVRMGAGLLRLPRLPL